VFREIICAFAVAGVLGAGAARAGEWDFGGEVAGELRAFLNKPANPGQFDHWQPALALSPDIRWASDDGKHRFVFKPYAKLDAQDGERTHYDVREGYYRFAPGPEVALTIGAAKVFWGRTESRHLVDIINQADAVEDIDEEDKLGQPMVNLTLVNDWGTLDFFAMSGFRDRTFPGRRGRPRFSFVIDTDDPIFESSARRKAPDFALRYSRYFGGWDIGVAGFYGTSREPRFAVDAANSRLIPIYDRIAQGSIDVQYTTGAWLFKAEAIVREGQGDVFFASVAGFEYTLYQVFGSNADLGLLGEYLYDGRDDGFRIENFSSVALSGPAPASITPFTAFQNDVFVGARLGLNDPQDTSAIAGVIVDAEDGSLAVSAEASRRIGANWRAEVEGRFFMNVDSGNLLNAFRSDDFVTLRLTRFF
jgi:hypothetical protein